MDWAVALTCSAALERLSDAPRTSVTILVSETMVWLRSPGGAKHTGVVGFDLGQVASGQGLHHPDHVVEAGIDHLSDAIDPSQGLEEAILAGQIHAAVQFAVDHRLHDLRHLPLDGDFLGAIRPLDHGPSRSPSSPNTGLAMSEKVRPPSRIWVR